MNNPLSRDRIPYAASERASIKVALPANRCERVRDVVRVLSVLEAVYTELYALCGRCSGHANTGSYGNQPRRRGAGIAPLGEPVPASDLLCLAQIEVDPPAYVEIVGGRQILRIIQKYLAKKNGASNDRDGRVRNAKGLLHTAEFFKEWGRESRFAELFAALERLDSIAGLALYEENRPGEFAATGQMPNL